MDSNNSWWEFFETLIDREKMHKINEDKSPAKFKGHWSQSLFKIER